METTMSKKIQGITVMALVLAIRLALEMIPSLSMGNIVQIGFGFIGAALSGALLGPVGAAVIGLFTDVFGTLLKGGGGTFFVGYTLTAIVGGWIYGVGLYRKPTTAKRIVATVTIITLVCNLGLNSIWVYMMTGKAFTTFMGIRIVKNLISLPLNSVILYLLLNHPTLRKMIEKFRR